MRKPDWIEIKEGNGARPEFWWHKKSANGRIIALGRGYNSRSGARRAAKRANPGVTIR